tara:strand:+ start:193 stop:597 length:405 start_codon:yes stop_codon:yes gene_type:complete
MFVVSLVGKHVLKAVNDDIAHYWFREMPREIVTISFFQLALILVCSQVIPSVFSGIWGYAYVGTFVVIVIGNILAGKKQFDLDQKDEDLSDEEIGSLEKLRKIRLFAGHGLSLALTIILVLVSLIDPWCNHFYF